MIKHRRDLHKILVQGNAAEIGVAEGLFSRDMLEWPCNFPIVYMVDRWKCCPDVKGDSAQSQEWHSANYRNVLKLTAPFGERAVILRGDSHIVADQVPDRSLSLVYVDGDHSYDGVSRDIRAWLPKLLSGGIMAFHDYEMPQYGVKRAVQDAMTYLKMTNKISDFGLLPEDAVKDAGAWFRVN